jgi:hypothetical protein
MTPQAAFALAARSASGGPAPSNPQASGRANRGWLQAALANTLASRGDDTPAWATLAQRLFGFAELNEIVSSVEANGRPDGLAALAEALQIPLNTGYSRLRLLSGIRNDMGCIPAAFIIVFKTERSIGGILHG